MKDNTLDNKIELVLKPKDNYKQNVSESNVSNCQHVSAGNLAIRIKKKKKKIEVLKIIKNSSLEMT